MSRITYFNFKESLTIAFLNYALILISFFFGLAMCNFKAWISKGNKDSFFGFNI
jgi:hypothetical protein